MFTGIVEELGQVVALTPTGDSARLVVRGPRVLEDVAHGDSISVSGCCLTVTSWDGDEFTADVIGETLLRTTVGSFTPGDRVNLERAVPAGGRLGGHVVQGHVDGVGSVLDRTPGDAWETVRFTLPRSIGRYVAEKGSIALDGTSLTVVSVDDEVLDGEPVTIVSVGLIPTTLEETTVGRAAPGTRVNVEVDVLAKYVERLLATREGYVLYITYNIYNTRAARVLL